jgi:hypothetical protein
VGRGIAQETTRLVEEVRAGGTTFSARRLEDWIHLGLVPRGVRRSLGRGRGSCVVYSADMSERCREVAELMRPGQPWQQVALTLFVRGVELPEETVRTAYRWALGTSPASQTDPLSAAEEGLKGILGTVEGRRFKRAVTSHIKGSGLYPNESARAVAQSVLTNIARMHQGSAISSDDAVIELMVGVGLPIEEDEPAERVEIAHFLEDAMDLLQFSELMALLESVSFEDLQEAVPPARALFESIPGDLSRLIPTECLDVVRALLCLSVVGLRREMGLEIPDGPARGG